MSQQTADRVYSLAPRDRTGWLLGLGGRQVLLLGAAMVTGVLIASGTGSTKFAIPPVLASMGMSFARVGGLPLVDVVGPGFVWGIRSIRGRTRWRAPYAAEGIDDPALPPPLAGHRDLVVDGARYHSLRAGSAITVTHDPSARIYAATVRVTATAGEPFSLIEPGRQHLRLDRWGDALAGFCRERSPVVWVRWAEWAAPGGNEEQLAYLADYGHDDPLDPAVVSYRNMLTLMGPLATRHDVLVTVAVSADRIRSKQTQGDREAHCVDTLLSQLRLFADRLESGGLRVSAPLGPQEQAAALRERMAPPARPASGNCPQSLLARLGRQRPARSPRELGVAWAPGESDACWAAWAVDGSYHRAFHVAEWPRLGVGPTWMAPMLAWGATLRTVAVIFEPMSLRSSQRAIERQATKLASDRAHRESKGFRVPAHHRRAARAVDDREEELVAGYAELEYTGLVTVSAPNPAELEHHCAQLAQLAAGCAVVLEPLDGRHDLATAACLPMARGLSRSWVA